MDNEKSEPWKGQVRDEKIARAMAKAELAIRDGKYVGSLYADAAATPDEALDRMGEEKYYNEGIEITKTDLPENVLAAFVKHAAEKSVNIDDPDAVEFRAVALADKNFIYSMNYDFREPSDGRFAGRHRFTQVPFDSRRRVLQEITRYAEDWITDTRNIVQLSQTGGGVRNHFSSTYRVEYQPHSIVAGGLSEMR